MKKTRFAVLDLGTNTFNLLICEKNQLGLQVLCEERIATKIGKGGIQNQRITPEACNRAVEALKTFAGIVQGYDVKQVKTIATSAFRNAANGVELCQRILADTGLKIDIIDGNKEAELIYLGVRASGALGKFKSLVMDIGGGSVEFILCDVDQIFWKRSYEIGAQRLLEMFHTNDPILQTELSALENYLSSKLGDLQSAIDTYLPQTLVGSSGTFDSLSDIYLAPLNKNHTNLNQHWFELPISFVESTFRSIQIKNKAERLQIDGLIEMRVDMIVVSLALLQFILKLTTFEHLNASFYSLKEGVMQLMIEESE